MNAGRFVGAAVGIGIVRIALNSIFYTRVVGKQFAQIAVAHPGVLRTVIPAYIVADLIFAFVFAFLFVKVAGALGGGIKAGIKLGVLVAILSPVLGNIYIHYSVTYMPAGLAVTDSVFQVIAHAIEGAVAGLIYRTQRKSM